MKKSYKVIVWGPGGVGRACLRELIRVPEFELVGVLAFNPAKNGKDVGDLLGLPPTGVIVTTDKEAIFKLKADCVLYTGAPPFDAAAMDEVVMRFLESGTNVICSTAYFFPPLQGQAYVDKLENACRKGGASLHGTGENPGFMMERLALTVTGLCNRVERMSVREAVDVSRLVGEALKQYGFGQDPEVMRQPGPLDDLWKKYLFAETISLTSMAIYGRMPDEIEHISTYEPAEKDIVIDYMTVEKGKVALIRHDFYGHIDSARRLHLQMTWYLGKENSPFAGTGGSDNWKIEIEGYPCSIRMDLEALASIDRNQELHEGDETIQSYYATGVVLVQAIPVVCEAQPGIVYPRIFAHCTADLATLGSRTSIADVA